MLRASSLSNPRRSATIVAHIVMSGARLTTVLFTFRTSSYTLVLDMADMMIPQSNENTNLFVQDLVEIHASVCRRFVRRCLGQEFVQVIVAFAFLLWRDLREPSNHEKASDTMEKEGRTSVCTVLGCLVPNGPATGCARLSPSNSRFRVDLEYRALRTAAITSLRESLSLTPSTCNLASSSWAKRAGVLYSLNLDWFEEVLEWSKGRDKHFTGYGHCLWDGDIVAR